MLDTCYNVATKDAHAMLQTSVSVAESVTVLRRNESSMSQIITPHVIKEKVCSKCGELKSVESFPRDRRRLDGRNAACAMCYNENQSQLKHTSKLLGQTNEQREHLREIERQSGRKRRIRMRRLVLKAYGGHCQCCGEAQYEFLAIDHINGGGLEHRRQVGQNIYPWLVKNQFPDGFQVLCHNCNLAKNYYGSCPHQQEALDGN